MKEDDSELNAAMNQIEKKYGLKVRAEANEFISDALSVDQPLSDYEVLYVTELLIRGSRAAIC